MRRFRALLLPAFAALFCLNLSAQNFTVLHTFTGSNDGASPFATLTMDAAGNLYGTAEAGGSQGAGTVFKLTNRSSGWLLTTLYSFTGGEDGAQPRSSVIFGPDGRLYGNTYAGGNPICGGCGTIYSLRPQPQACASANCSWQESTLYQFPDAQDGQAFPWGNLLFDAAGNIYGTTLAGGGIVYKLSPGLQGWTYQTLYSFVYSEQARQPYAGVISDTAGNLFGTTYGGGSNDDCWQLQSCGTVFELSPAGSSWVLTIIHDFDGNDGGLPIGGLISDRFGNLYGANSMGVIYMLSPAGGSWSFSNLATVEITCDVWILGPSCGPWDTLAMGADGSLYGTSRASGLYAYGNVFRLTPSNGGWIYDDLHDFTNGSDGSAPIGGVTLDASGNLYGTTAGGGSAGVGVVFEITQ